MTDDLDLDQFCSSVCDDFYVVNSNNAQLFESVDGEDALCAQGSLEQNHHRRGDGTMVDTNFDIAQFLRKTDEEPDTTEETILSTKESIESSDSMVPAIAQPPTLEQAFNVTLAQMANFHPAPAPAMQAPMPAPMMVAPAAPMPINFPCPAAPITDHASREWTLSQQPLATNLIHAFCVYIRQARSKRESFTQEVPLEMYSYPYTYCMLIRLKLNNCPTSGSLLPTLRYSVALVDAETTALMPGGIDGEMVATERFQQPTCVGDTTIVEAEGKIYIDKKYLSYRSNNRQFRFSVSVYSNTELMAQTLSAPYTVYSKRKEAVHGYNKKGTKRQKGALADIPTQVGGLPVAEQEEADRVVQQIQYLLCNLNINQRTHVLSQLATQQ